MEYLLDRILDVWPEGVYISDGQGKTLKVNKVYEQLTGLKQQNIIGKYVADLQGEGIFDVVINPEVVKYREPRTSVQITKEGRRVILNGFPVFDDAGDVVNVVTFVRDVTSLYQLKEQLVYQQQLIDTYHHELARKERHSGTLIMESPTMVELMKVLENIAKTDATVLLLGETGVGKDVLAHRIHEHSQRSSQPFFKVDCGTIPSNLVESELFGYEGGAFSGANSKGKPGFIEMAHNGTLFLDEIGELPLPMQTRLLRFLQDQEFMRVGSTRVKKVDVRVVAATNRNLEKAVKEGVFRSDLFYRLRVAVLNIPPLRERKGDIPVLVEHFLNYFNLKYKKRTSFSPVVMQIFRNYDWPGNIREMENLIQSLVVTRNTKVIELADLPQNMLPPAIAMDARSLHDIVSDVEKDLLKKALIQYGSINEIAKFYNVDRVTIYRKLKKYSLT